MRLYDETGRSSGSDSAHQPGTQQRHCQPGGFQGACVVVAGAWRAVAACRAALSSAGPAVWRLDIHSAEGAQLKGSGRPRPQIAAWANVEAWGNTGSRTVVAGHGQARLDYQYSSWDKVGGVGTMRRTSGSGPGGVT